MNRLAATLPEVGDVGTAPAPNALRRLLGIPLGTPHPPVRLWLVAYGDAHLEVEVDGDRHVRIDLDVWREWAKNLIGRWGNVPVPPPMKNTTGEQLTLPTE